MIAPLSHIRVLDLSRILAGPWAGQTLADLGADVLKVEHPERGDDTRKWGPPFLKDQEGDRDSAYFLSANRNKRSIAINFKMQEGAEIIKRLVTKCDVVIENFKPGVLKKYGLDFCSLKKIQPRIIYCSITGYGQSGPCRNQAGYDFSIQGEAGYMSVTGTPDEENGQPTKVGVAITDLLTGLYAATSICAALANQKQEACHLDLSLFDCLTGALANQAMNYLVGGTSPERLGNRHPNIAPYESFQAQDGFFILAVGNDMQFEKLCVLLGHQEWKNKTEFKTNEGRVLHQKQLSKKITKVIRKRPIQYWLELFKDNGIPCGPINTIQQVFEHPQIQARGMVETLMAKGVGSVHLLASPLKHAGARSVYYFPPKLGEHTQTLLRKYLGASDTEIKNWQKLGVIALKEG